MVPTHPDTEVSGTLRCSVRLDSKTGLVIREDRFLNALWPQVGEIHDMNFVQTYGTFFTAKKPLALEGRFPPPKPKNKNREYRNPKGSHGTGPSFAHG